MILFPHNFLPTYVVSLFDPHNLGPFFLPSNYHALGNYQAWRMWGHGPALTELVLFMQPFMLSDFQFCKLITLLSSRLLQILLPLPFLLFFLLLNGVISLMLRV